MKKITVEQLSSEADAFAVKAGKVDRTGLADDPWILYIRYWWTSHQVMRHRADITRICLDLGRLEDDDTAAGRVLSGMLDQELTRHINALEKGKDACDSLRGVYPILRKEFDQADKSASSWLVIRPEAEAVEP